MRVKPRELEGFRWLLRKVRALFWMRLVVEILILRIVAIVGNTRVWTLRVAILVYVEPGVTPCQVFAHREAHVVLARILSPSPDHVALRAHIDGIPAMVLRVPTIEVVAMDAKR